MENQAAAIDPRAAVKRAVFLIILFVLVITGAFAIKVGVEDGYLSRIKSFMRSGIGLNLPATEQENISPADINVDKLLPADSSKAIGQNSNTDTNKPTAESSETLPVQPKSVSKPIAAAPKPPVVLNSPQTPQTLEAQVAGLSKQIEAISSEVKKMEALNEIQSQISVISVKVNEISKNVSELKSQSSLTDLQAATSKVNMGTAAFNSTIALNPAGK